MTKKIRCNECRGTGLIKSSLRRSYGTRPDVRCWRCKGYGYLLLKLTDEEKKG